MTVRYASMVLALRSSPGVAVTDLEQAASEVALHSADITTGRRVICCTASFANHVDRATSLAADVRPFLQVLEQGMPPVEMPVSARDFDVVLTVRSPIADDPAPLVGVASSVIRHVAGLVDPEQSAVVVGVEHVIVPGTGQVEFFYCIARKPPLTHDTFSTYWLRTFTSMHSRHTPGKAGYHQLHADVALTKAAARATGVALDTFDGVAVEWFADVDDFMLADAHGRATAGPGAAFMDGERMMNDFARARAMLGFALVGGEL